jgi:hypothetical protein
MIRASNQNPFQNFIDKSSRRLTRDTVKATKHFGTTDFQFFGNGSALYPTMG